LILTLVDKLNLVKNDVILRDLERNDWAQAGKLAPSGGKDKQLLRVQKGKPICAFSGFNSSLNLLT
jgi:hypothetical protein